MSAAIPTSAHVSVYRGTELTELASGADYVKVLPGSHDLPASFERGDSPRGPWVKIAKADLDRRFARTVTATHDGQQVAVTGTGDGVAHVAFNGSPVWAAEHDLEGSQHEGWAGSVPLTELTDISTTEKDLP